MSGQVEEALRIALSATGSSSSTEVRLTQRDLRTSPAEVSSQRTTDRGHTGMRGSHSHSSERPVRAVSMDLRTWIDEDYFLIYFHTFGNILTDGPIWALTETNVMLREGSHHNRLELTGELAYEPYFPTPSGRVNQVEKMIPS